MKQKKAFRVYELTKIVNATNNLYCKTKQVSKEDAAP